MGRRSNFLRIDKDAYDTPPKAVLPLLPHLHPGIRFIEPCGGKGAESGATRTAIPRQGGQQSGEGGQQVTAA